MSKNQIIAILFSDLVGYSRLKNDNLKEKIDIINEQFSQIYLNEDNHIFLKTWGDALYICSTSYYDLATISLNLRDYIKTYNWIKEGFTENIKIRIGLHSSEARIITSDNKIKDIVGTSIDTAARIEPITLPNEVYCSEAFYTNLKTLSNSNFSFVPIGEKELAKSYGSMTLYILKWAHEDSYNLQIQNVTPNTSSKNSDSTELDYSIKLYERFKIEEIISLLEMSLNENYNWSPSRSKIASFVLRELTDNAFEHGCLGDGESTVTINAKVESSGDFLTLIITSPGPGFNLKETIEQNNDFNAGTLSNRGNGLQLVNKVCYTLDSDKEGIKIFATIKKVSNEPLIEVNAVKDNLLSINLKPHISYGTIDKLIETFKSLIKTLDKNVQLKNYGFLLSLKDVERFDSSGMGGVMSILTMCKQIPENKCSLSIVFEGNLVYKELLYALSLDKYILFFETIEEAEKYFDIYQHFSIID